MKIHSAYIVQSQVVGMGPIPLETKADIRPIFRPIFESRNCFTDLRKHIQHLKRPQWDFSSISGWQRVFPPPIPSKPFIRNLGRICLSTQSARLTSSSAYMGREFLADLLREGKEHWYHKREDEQFLYDDHYRFIWYQVFGYDRDLEDQRMFFLYFELQQPLFMKAVLNEKTEATGKVFLHLYPSGLLVIVLAISLKLPSSKSLKSLHEAIRETRPGRSDGHWIWTTRLGSGTLCDIVNLVKGNVYKSLYEKYPKSLRESAWHSAVKLVTTEKPGELPVQAAKVASFFKGKYEVFNISKTDRHTPGYDLLTSRQGIFFLNSQSQLKWHKREASLRLFWKIFTIFEFVMVKEHIYENCADYLSAEITNLREFRLSTLRKITKEDIRRLSVYNPQIPRYLQALDNHIKNASPFHRRLYSSISFGTGFDSQRERLKELVKEWEKEVEQWEHGLKMMWSKIISPLRSLLGSLTI